MEGFSYNKKSVLEKYDTIPTIDSERLVDSGAVRSYVDGQVNPISKTVYGTPTDSWVEQYSLSVTTSAKLLEVSYKAGDTIKISIPAPPLVTGMDFIVSFEYIGVGDHQKKFYEASITEATEYEYTFPEDIESIMYRSLNWSPDPVYIYFKKRTHTDGLVADVGYLKQAFVTPEMFGAKGDGVTDDTQAWQNAVDAGVTVKATKTNYKCGQISITKNIDIDCNGADFTCTTTTLFDCKGEVVTILTEESNYSANQSNYTISNSSYSDYSGMIMLIGTNNFNESRDYYYGGFVATTKNGVINQSYPINVSGDNGISIEIITPITVRIHNIGSITHPLVGGQTRSINILYGINCVVENVNSYDVGSYVYITYKRCLNCVCRNINIKMSLGTEGTNSYIVAWEDSSYCSLLESILHNDFWHCVTTGANYLCYSNIINNSVLTSYTGIAYGDHANGLHTILKNSTFTCVSINDTGIVDNVIIQSRNSTGKPCVLSIACNTDAKLVGTTIKNVTFIPDPTTPQSSLGVVIGIYPQDVTGKTFYVDDLIIDHVIVRGSALGQIYYNFISSRPSECFVVLKTISISDTNLDIHVGTKSDKTYIDITDFRLFISNIFEKVTYLSSGSEVTTLPGVSNADEVYKYVSVKDSKIRSLRGKYDELELDNVHISGGISDSVLLVKSLRGRGVTAYIYNTFWFPSDQTYTMSKVNITDLQHTSPKEYWINLCIDSSHKCYQKWVNGVLTTTELTQS